MKILWNAQFGSGWDQRISTRDVCVVTRQPLLSRLVSMGHEITFTNKPKSPTDEDIRWVEKVVNNRLIKLNDSRVTSLNNKIKYLDNFEKEFKPNDYDVAITELRTPLYFHDEFPIDVKIQRQIWASALPSVIWDKDLWGVYESKYIDTRKHVIVGPTSNYGIANPGFGDIHKKIDFGFDDDLQALGSFRNEDCVKLGYLGSQYNREDELFRFFAKPAKKFKVRMVGKMYDNVKAQIPSEFLGRTPIIASKQILDNFETTVHICPKYYSYAGHVTYRVYEGTASEACLLADSTIRGITNYVVKEALVDNSDDVERIVNDYSHREQIKRRQREWLFRTFTDVAIDFTDAAEDIIFKSGESIEK